MKTIIYYFTGTGNSLAAARRIAAALEECELVPIASLAKNPGTIVPEAERVGLVCPVYDGGVPVLVAEFAARLDLSRAGYAFAVVTMGGLGVSALRQLDDLIRTGRGRGLDAAFAVRMPGNFPPLYRPPSGTRRDEALAAAAVRLAEIGEAVAGRRAVPPGVPLLSAVVKAITYGSFAKHVHEGDASFSVSAACTGCGTCAKVCPAGNIALADDRPAWQHRCELCCACLHFCPLEAIQLNVMLGTEGRGRYRHPALTVADMEDQRNGTIAALVGRSART